jgi:hypothetical protein
MPIFSPSSPPSPRRYFAGVFRGGVIGLLSWVGIGSGVGADTIPFTFTKVGSEYRLELPTDPMFYYGFLQTHDLRQPFAIRQMAMGSPGPTFGYVPGADEPRGFFRARSISVSAPEDQDNDYLDDIWEIQRSAYLDPLNPNDAFQPSPEPDAGGRNNLDYYRFKRGIIALKEAITREVSIFNFGAPSSAQEAISRETSVFNFGSPLAAFEAVSREISVFNGESVPTSDIPEVYSREVTTFNFGSPPANIEAISRELSVFNGESVPTGDIPEVYSREVTAFNFGEPTAPIEAISREVSVLNTEP